jgi:hypothetical protein
MEEEKKEQEEIIGIEDTESEVSKTPIDKGTRKR